MARYTPPYPFLKWAGGKRKQTPDILQRMPAHFDVYAEPFLGGGAVFLALAKEGRFDYAVLCDRNPELINLWIQVRDAVEGVMEAARQWRYGKDEYYAVRATTPTDPVEAAARTLWLNRTCFNGLYRKNRGGGFNVPFGSHKNPRIVNEENLRACSEVLQGVELDVRDFAGLLEEAGPGWVVYCDPPYWPVSSTAKFTAYDGFVFTEADHVRLADSFAALPARGAHGVLSNSSTPQTYRWYTERGLDISTVQARRSINRNGDGRGPVEELLVATGGG